MVKSNWGKYISITIIFIFFENINNLKFINKNDIKDNDTFINDVAIYFMNSNASYR